MIRNNKGAILVVTIVSMMILTIIGYVTLQMVSNQNVMDTYNQTKIRVDYAAEGIVEKARGYIDYYTNKHYVDEDHTASIPGSDDVFWGDVGRGSSIGNGMLYSIMYEDLHGDDKWFVFKNTQDDASGVLSTENTLFDNSVYPNVFADVYCEIVDISTEGFTNINNTVDPTDNGIIRSYRLVGIASATVSAANGSVIVSTATCYFYTKKLVLDDSSDANKKKIEITNHIRGWRKS